jgi:hypothetical protein
MADNLTNFHTILSVNTGDCPVQIVRAETTENYLFENLELRNTADKVVTSVTLGLWLYREENPLTGMQLRGDTVTGTENAMTADRPKGIKGLLLRAKKFEVSLAPQDLHSIRLPDFPRHLVASRSHAAIMSGLLTPPQNDDDMVTARLTALAVTFNDRTEWTLPVRPAQPAR